jgi:putative sigma-54 modulation protein
MKIDIRALHFELEAKERDYVAEKIGHLEKYYRNVIGSDVAIECDHEDSSGSTYILKAVVKIPGKDLFAETESRDIFSGVDVLEQRLKEQIIKVKEKSNPKKLYRAKEWVRNFFGK